MVKIEDNRLNDDTSMKFGDAIKYDEELYFAIPIDNGSRMIFISFSNNGCTSIWNSNGIKINNGKVTIQEVQRHFGGRDISHIPKEKIDMTIKLN